MILVTGANGFIGSVLVKDLNKKGYKDLLVSDYVSLEERPQLLENAEYTKFIDPDELLDSINNYKDLEAIFHMGACSSTTETDWDYLQKVNLDYTKTLFKFCCTENIPLYYASSAAVYGAGEHGFDDIIDPRVFKSLNLYGKSKLDFDVWAVQQEIQPQYWYGFRFFNVYGPNEYFKGPMASVVYKAYHQIKENGSLKLFRSHNEKYKDGEQLRDFVYVKDVTKWMIEYFENKRTKPGIYNMGFGTAHTWLDLANAVFKAMGKEPNIEWIDIPENIREQYQYFTEANMEKHHSRGRSNPEWPLDEAVDDYVKDHLDKGDVVY